MYSNSSEEEEGNSSPGSRLSLSASKSQMSSFEGGKYGISVASTGRNSDNGHLLMERAMKRMFLPVVLCALLIVILSRV